MSDTGTGPTGMLNMNMDGRDPLDASMDGAGEILLRVKSASHPSCEDLEFRAKSSFSIKQIKETIQRLSAQHPEVKEQRLIYSGHLLDDNQVLKDVLTSKAALTTEIQQPVTIHLACTSKYIFNSGANSSSKTSAQPKPTNEGSAPGTDHTPMFGAQGIPSANFGIPAQMQQGNGNIPQEYFAVYQQYVEQMQAYMNQWYMQQGLAPGGFFYQIPQMPNTPGVPPMAHQPAPQAQAQAQPERVEENRNLAAARAAADEDDQRDLLDWMYTLSRLVLILSVVYFYSSFSRFILVILFTGLVMMLQRRNHARVNAPDRLNPNAPQQEQPARPANAEPNQQMEDPGPREDTEEATEEIPVNDAAVPDAEIRQNEPPAPQRSIQDIALTFLTTFFTSLIPENYHNA